MAALQSQPAGAAGSPPLWRPSPAAPQHYDGLNANAQPYVAGVHTSARSPPAAADPPPHPPRRGRAERGPRQKAPRQAPPKQLPQDNRTMAVTPWYPDGVQREHVTLRDEIDQLAAFLGLTAEEHRRRQGLIDAVAASTREQWGPRVRVRAYGSYAAGTSAATSAVDLSVERCGALTADDVARVAARVGLPRSAVMCTGDNAFAQLQCRDSGVIANVSFAAGAGAKQAATTVREWLAEFPGVAAAHAVLRQVLLQTGNLDVSTGGMSSHCLLAMLVACCRSAQARAHPRQDAASYLVHFCCTYGRAWDFAAHSIDPITGVPPPVRAHTTELVSVLDPTQPTNNLAAGCTRIFAITAQLQHCAAALVRWGDAGSRGVSYRGKTPLSSILSHQKLQARTEQLRELRTRVVAAPRRYGEGQLYALRSVAAARAGANRQIGDSPGSPFIQPPRPPELTSPASAGDALRHAQPLSPTFMSVFSPAEESVGHSSPETLCLSGRDAGIAPPSPAVGRVVSVGAPQKVAAEVELVDDDDCPPLEDDCPPLLCADAAELVAGLDAALAAAGEPCTRQLSRS